MRAGLEECAHAYTEMRSQNYEFDWLSMLLLFKDKIGLNSQESDKTSKK